MPDKICKNCNWWKANEKTSDFPGKENWGYCHRSQPTTDNLVEIENTWFCAYFEEKQDA